MKNYKSVEMFAKNAPTGSYAAGCPANYDQRGSSCPVGEYNCKKCERTM